MALWSSTNGKLYLPPSTPVARVLSTDEYVKGTDVYFHARSDRLLIVGHPYYDINDGDDLKVPKVSANQYRVFRCELPDPNKFALIDTKLFNSDTERLVWKLTGIEVGRGGPLGVGSTGHPLFNKIGDTENPAVYLGAQQSDERQNASVDPKQTQLLIVGCKPAVGEYWDLAEACDKSTLDNGKCPPIQLVNSYIQDGDMGDIGFGNANFPKLQQDRAGVPLDLVDSVSLWPDFLKMTKDVYGDSIFFYAKQEQLYARHLFTHAGPIGEPIPQLPGVYYHDVNNAQDERKTLNSYLYFTTPSGSLNTSSSQLFNRPYWIRRAQGTNNCICWGNEVFVTVFDNTRNVNFNISVKSDKNPLDPLDVGASYKYNTQDFKQYSRHTEEFELEFIFQLCKVGLNADVLAHLNVMDPRILENWQLAYVPPAPSGIGDTYRYLKSVATKCPPKDSEGETEDPYKQYTFWNVNLTEKFSSELDQYALGRKFLYQTGLLRKRVRSDYTVATVSKPNKRKRTK
uniref:Major capsid protein L1 n=1 Tax=Human papillomavirus TaxID=10566 RepID=A0A3R5T6V0_9PAPI|nr:MAG: L1 protein [Human papillomavirus]